MSFGIPLRILAALLLAVVIGGSRAGAAQDNVDESSFEFGVGLYLSNCDSLVEGTALFDLGDAELETEDFSGADENEAAGEATESVEDEIETESEGGETDVEGAIGTGEDQTEDPDRVVVVQEDAPLVWVAESEAFEADLAELVTAPFAVAIRMSTQGEAAQGQEGDESGFLVCGEFGGAVAGNTLILPLEPIGDSGFNGIAVLEQQEEGQSTASIYLFGDAPQGDGQDGDTDEAEGQDEQTDESEGQDEQTDESEDQDEQTDEAEDQDEQTDESEDTEESEGADLLATIVAADATETPTS